MPEKQLNNAAGAFGYSDEPGINTKTFVAGGNITANTIVHIQMISGSPVVYPCGAADYPIGVSPNTVAAGGIVEVITMGVAMVTAGTGGTTADTLAGVLASGAVGPAAAVGLNVGVALTNTTATNLATVFVSPR